MDPMTIASLALGGTNMLSGLMGKGGGGAPPAITKQDNYQNTTLNISVGGMADAVRASLPFPGAMSASYATPVGYSAEGFQPQGGGILQTLQDNWIPIAAALGVIVLYRRLA